MTPLKLEMKRISKTSSRHPTASLALVNLLLPFLLSYHMFPADGIIGYGDAGVQYNIRDFAPNLLNTWSPNYLGQPQATALFSQFPKGLATLVLVDLHMSLATASYILSFGLLYAAALVTSLIAFRVSKHISVAIFAGTFTVLCDASLQSMAYGSYFFYFSGSIAFAGFLYLAWSAHQRDKWCRRSVIATCLLSLLTFQPFFFAMFMGLVLAFALFWLRSHGRRQIGVLATTLVGPLIVGSYWLLPFWFSYREVSSASATFIGGNLLGVYNGVISVASYLNVVSLFEYPGWDASPFNAYYARVTVLVIIIATVAILVFKDWRRPSSNFSRWLLLVAFIALNLGMGPRSPISGGAWRIIWDHTSALQFFRTFTRFLGLIPPLLIMIVAIKAAEERRRWLLPMVILWTAALVLMNLNFFNGSLGGSVAAIRVPIAYAKAAEVLNRLPNEAGSILAFPATSYEPYTWSQSANHPYQAFYIQDDLFDRPITYSRISLPLPTSSPQINSALANHENPAELTAIRGLGVRFVLVHKDMLNPVGQVIQVGPEDAFFRSHTTLIFQSQYFDLFELQSAAPIVGGAGVTSKELNSALYSVQLSHVTGLELVTLLQQFNVGWGLYVVPWNGKSLCNSLSPAKSSVATTCAGSLSYAVGTTLRSLAQHPANNVVHVSEKGWANAWQMNIQELVAALPHQYYVRNGDGTYNLNLMLEFRPQAYFYLGLLITLMSIVIAIAGLAVEFIRLRRRRSSSDANEQTQQVPRFVSTDQP